MKQKTPFCETEGEERDKAAENSISSLGSSQGGEGAPLMGLWHMGEVGACRPSGWLLPRVPEETLPPWGNT